MWQCIICGTKDGRTISYCEPQMCGICEMVHFHNQFEHPLIQISPKKSVKK